MATLKGQNFRIMIQSGQGSMKCIGMATNCVVTLGTNQEDASTKDTLGMASHPTIVSKNWSVQVESLNVTDTANLLTTIKSLTLFELLWDETSTTDNQTNELATFSRIGKAYLTDATFQFDDRTNSTKSLQFIGVGELSTVTGAGSTYSPSDTFTKGQFVRLLLSSDNTTAPSFVIAAARSLSLHISLQMESATTKDTEGDWEVQEPTALNYDISTTALVRSGDTITSLVGAKELSDLETIYENATPVKWKIANTSGANNRTVGTTIISGSCLIQTLTINGQNRQAATYTAQLVGYDSYTVGS